MGTSSADFDPIKRDRGRSRLFLTGAVLIFLMAGLFLWNRDSDDYVRGPVIKRAVAVITGPTVEGTVYFSQNSPKEAVTITGSLRNVSPNANRGFTSMSWVMQPTDVYLLDHTTILKARLTVPLRIPLVMSVTLGMFAPIPAVS